MLTVRKKWASLFVQRTVVAGAALVLSASGLFAQAPAAGAAGGTAGAAAGGATTPGAGGAAPGVGGAGVGGNAAVNPGVGGGAAVGGAGAPGIGVGGAAPPAGVGVGGAAPPAGIGVGGAARPAGPGRVAPNTGLNRPAPGTNAGRGLTPAQQRNLQNQNLQNPNGQAAARANALNAAQGNAQAQTSNGAANAAARGTAAGRANTAIPRNIIPGSNLPTAAQQRIASRRGVSGTISGINSNNLTFTNSAGAAQQLTLTPDTQVQFNGENVALADLPANANVRVFTNPNNPSEIQRIVASSNAGSAGRATPADPDGTAANNPLGFEGQGNDVAGTVNPDGTTTPGPRIIDPSGQSFESPAEYGRNPRRREPRATIFSEADSNAGTGGRVDRSAARNPLGLEGQQNDVTGAVNPDPTTTPGPQITDPSGQSTESPAEFGNNPQRREPVARPRAGGSTREPGQAAGNRSSENPLGFEGQGNDVAGRVNPDGTITPNPDLPEGREQAQTGGQAMTGTAAGQPRATGAASRNAGAAAGGSRPTANASTNRNQSGTTGRVTRENFNGPTVDLGWKLQQSNQGIGVSNLSSSGVAAQAGLQNGDVITSINGRAVSSPRDLSFELNRLSANSEVDLQVQRDGQSVKQTLTLPQTHQPLFPRSAEEITEENRELEAQVEAAKNKD